MNQSFYTRYGWVIILLMASMSIFVIDGARRAMQSQSNRVEDWLPAHYQETKDLKWFHDHFAGEDLLMISWDGCTLDDPRSKTFVERLRQPGNWKQTLSRWIGFWHSPGTGGPGKPVLIETGRSSSMHLT